MTDTVSGILGGHFRQSGKGLEFSLSGINEKIREGDCLSGSFSVRSLAGKPVRCRVLTDTFRLSFSKDYFEDDSFEVFYEFDARCLQSGFTEKGRIYFVSNEGEYSIPVHIEVIRNSLTTSRGEIRNLFHFANLARTDWDEAKKIFYSGDLERILAGNDDRFLPVYRVLSSGEMTDEGLDEFLICTGKKSPAEYVPDKDLLVINDPLNDIRRSLRITRNGWGSANLLFETDTPFIRLEKAYVTEDDLLGNEFELGFFIRNEYLHDGINLGEIRFSYGARKERVTISVNSGTPDRAAAATRRKKEELRVSLTQYYVNYMLGKISPKIWEKETSRLLEELIGISREDPEPVLLKAFSMLRVDKSEEASWILKQAYPRISSDDRTYLTSFYLCLSILTAKENEDAEYNTLKIREIYENSPRDWRTAIVLLHTDTEFIGDAEKKFSFLRDVFYRGCRSPMMYSEAFLVIKEEPSVLSELGDFELHVLSFMQKNSLMNREFADRFAELVRSSKNSDPYTLNLLKRCYRDEPDDAILYLICSMLMKKNADGEEAFRWYEAGVRQDIRITGLFDHFMMTMDLGVQHSIPQNVIKYYSYECTLPRDVCAYLYRYVASEREECGELYYRYLPRIKEFALKQIENKRISSDLAWLYLNVISLREMNKLQTECFADLLFIRVITTDDRSIKNVCSSFPQTNKVTITPFSDGKAYVPVYIEDACIAVEDDKGRRIVSEPHCRMDSFLVPENVSASFLSEVETNKYLDLYLIGGGSQPVNIKRSNFKRYLRIAGDDDFSLTLRKRITLRLISYLDSHDDEQRLQPFLALVTPDMVTLQDVPEIVDIFLKRKMYRKAFQWVSDLGTENIRGEVLLQLSRALAVNSLSSVSEKELLSLMSAAMEKGAYDEGTVKYLMKEFKGTLRMLAEIWRAALSLGLDRTGLDERILRQTIDSGAFLSDFWEICRDYISEGKPDEDLVNAVVMQESYNYFTEGRKCDRFLFSMISWLRSRGVTLHRVCGLAYVQYFSEHQDEITSDVEDVLIEFLHEQDGDATVLDCYAGLTDIDPVMLPFRDRAIISYRSAPGKKIMIHYVSETDGAVDDEAYRTEEMYEEFDGYYVKMFVLFFGEKIQYYITESEGEEMLTLNGTVTRSDPGNDIRSRFEMLDDICTGVVLHDFEEAEKNLDDYLRNDYISREVFGI